MLSDYCLYGWYGVVHDANSFQDSLAEWMKDKPLSILQLDPADRAVLRIADERDAIQKKTFTKWVNKHLKKSQSLKLESAGNVTIKARNSRGFITNILGLGEAGLQAIGNYFLVRGTSGNVLLQVDPHEMVVSANHMVVSDSGGLRLDGSLETPLVRGGATKDLRLESLLKKVKVRSEGAMNVDSPAGGIWVQGLRDMNLRSTGGRVVIDSSRLEMKNLKTSRHTKDKKGHDVFQVCMCDNGRLFLAHREGHCQIQESVCRDFDQDRYRMRETRSKQS